MLASVVAGSDEPHCNFECLNDSVCAAGVADFTNHPNKGNGDVLDIHAETERQGMHCACHPGFTGLFCKRKYEDCAVANHKCYHGGKCILGLNDIYGNDQLYCDCSEALDENGVRYVGKYCEIPKTETCDDEGNLFCVNSGWCKEDYGNYPRRPCHCGPDHDGPHCEFDKGLIPECTLDCNGGDCRLGIKKDIPGSDEFLYDFWKQHSDYQYCECPEGFHGLQCDIQSSKCGEHHCFHGGECVSMTEGTRHKHHCDCTKTHTKEISYAGKYCQYESDNYCDKATTENGQLFCVNDGVCHQQGSHLGCECPPGFHGPICEFKNADQPDDYEDCGLICDNGGQCRKGVKDTSWLSKFGPEVAHLSQTNTENFEHCVCEEGFLGVACEHKVEKCPDGEYACFHGAKCVAGVEGSSCDCQVGSTSLEKLAGKFCEHQSTTICTSGGGGFAFCVNDGTCVDVIDENNEEHPGCDCSEEFYGPHCEFIKRDANQGNEPDDTDNPNNNFPEESIPDDEPIHDDPNHDDPLDYPLPPQSSGNTNSNSNTGDDSKSNTGAIIGITVSAAVCAFAIALLVRQRSRSRKGREIEASLEHADSSPYSDNSNMIIPQPNTKTRRYRDFLDHPDTDPDVPNMGNQRPRGSYHDHVFDNVDLI